MNCTVCHTFIAEVLSQRLFLILGNVHRVLDKLIHALIFCRGNRHNRHAQQLFHKVYVYCTAVSRDLVHHVKGHYHGNVHLQKLHSKIHIPLDIGGINDVDYSSRLLSQHKIS